MDERKSETKLCKHCQTEIPKKAKVCPNCRKKQGGILKWVVIVLAILILLPAFAGNEDEEVKSDNQNQNNVVANNEKTEQSQENEISIGSSFEKNGLKISVNDVSTDFKDYKNLYDLNTPKEGMKYVMASFTFENNGKSDSYVSIYDFKCYADNTTCDQVYGLDDNDFINTNLSKGRNVSFKTYYSVPIDAQSVELEYETNAWTGQKVIIKIQ